jgi:hypothetical protein
MFFVYAIAGSVWAWLCYKHVTELLPIQVCQVLYTLGDLISISVLSLELGRVPCHRNGCKLG